MFVRIEAGNGIPIAPIQFNAKVVFTPSNGDFFLPGEAGVGEIALEVVPEPSTLVLAGLGACLAVPLAVRRARRAASKYRRDPHSICGLKVREAADVRGCAFFAPALKRRALRGHSPGRQRFQFRLR